MFLVIRIYLIDGIGVSRYFVGKDKNFSGYACLI